MSIVSFSSYLPDPEDEISGLSQAEAESRYIAGQDNSLSFKAGRTRGEIVRAAVFNVYTFDLLSVAAVFWLLNQPFSALFSVAIMLLLFVYNLRQAFQAKDRLDALLLLTQPEVSVIRESKLHAIDPDQIVPGDIVAVGPGDQFFADGRLLSSDPLTVNESWITGDLDPRHLQPQDVVLAGSYCLSGHGVYEVEAVGKERQVANVLDAYDAVDQPKTPLQVIVYRVLTALRILVVLFGAYIVLRFLFLESDPGQRPVYENALSIILGLAPGGIYFMILLTYITGSSQLAGSGALVQREEAVETLAQTDVLCLGKAGTLTGALVDFKPAEESGKDDLFSESRVQQILGDFARSTRSRSKLILAMKESFDGSRRQPTRRCPLPFAGRLAGTCH